MKKLIIAFVLFFALVAGVDAQTNGHTVPSDPRFMPTYNQALLLNEDRFADLDVIQIGDTVYFPSLSGIGVDYWIADYPANGVYDCIWNLTDKYLAGQIKTEPVQKMVEVKPITPTEQSSFWSSHLFFWLLVAFLISVTVAFIIVFYRYMKTANIDSNPVIKGGLSHNPAEAASQVAAITGSRVIRSERGRLICASPIKITMQFNDGAKKVNLVSGEQYYRITEVNGTIRYARQSCGNLIGGSISELPEGVTFVPSMEENSIWSSETANTTSVTPVTVVPITPEKPINDFEGLAKVLEVAGKMTNVPSKITFGELVVEFQPVSAPSIPEGDQK